MGIYSPIRKINMNLHEKVMRWLMKLCRTLAQHTGFSTSIVRIFRESCEDTISTKWSRSTMLHPVFIKVWAYKWAIFFVDTDECWCSGEIFGMYPVAQCRGVVVDWPVSRCCFIQEAEYWNESQYPPSVSTRRKMDALIFLRLYECGRKLRLYTKTRSRRIELSTLDNRFVSGELSVWLYNWSS